MIPDLPVPPLPVPPLPVPPLPVPPLPPPSRSVVFVQPADETRILAETIVAMAARGQIYQRGGRIVEPRRIPAPRARTANNLIARGGETWQIVEVTSPRMRLLAAESCQYMMPPSDTRPAYEVGVPQWLPHAVLAADWPFPTLTGIAEAPTMRPDGSIITQQGYDSETGIYLASRVSVIVPEAPTIDDARRAGKRLLDVICDFPFSSEAGRSVWLSGVLSVVARPAIDGPIPLHLIDASAAGAGKSKLVDAASIITTGQPASRTINHPLDDEWDKRISSLALAGDQMVLIDNVVGELGCASLDAALTATSYQGRILGKNKMTPHLPMRIVWWGTGNGVIIVGDLARRTLLARLEPDCEHPEERTGPRPGEPWRHPRLLHYVREQRAELLGAALTMVRAYVVAGRPPIPNLRPMDFDGWSDTVRAAIVWAGFADPAATATDVRAADTRADAIRSVVEHWPVPDDAAITAGELIEMAAPPMSFPPPVDTTAREGWRRALLGWCPGRRDGELPTAQYLGRALRSIRGRVIGAHKIDAGKHGERGVPWMRLRIELSQQFRAV